MPQVTDPGGNEVGIKWWQFQVGSYAGKVEIINPTSLRARIVIPKEVIGQTIHIVLEATYNEGPALMRHQCSIMWL